MAFVTGRRARPATLSNSSWISLAAAREERATMAAQMKAEFDAEVAALRSELREAYALMERLRASMPSSATSEWGRTRLTRPARSWWW
jgi:hypothetical protein